MAAADMPLFEGLDWEENSGKVLLYTSFWQEAKNETIVKRERILFIRGSLPNNL